MPVSADRINIVLPESDRDLADAIAAELGLGHGGRSAAIRYALRECAKKLGVSGPRKKDRKPT